MTLNAEVAVTMAGSLPGANSADKAAASGTTAAPRATILIVDDDPRNCELLEAMLRRDGHEPVAVANGEAALASIARQAPDLILLDIKLPGIDGYQVASALKEDPRTASIPIIVVTVLADRDARVSALKAGVEELVTKPIDPSELLLRVRNLLRLKTYGDRLQNQGLNLEQQVQARTRVYAVLSGINTLIVRARDRQELFSEACRIAVEQGGFKLAWIGLVDPSGTKFVPVASAGENDDLIDAIKDLVARSNDATLGDNMAARAIRARQPIVSNDSQHDPIVVLREIHVRSGIRSMAVLPMISADNELGALALYSSEAGFFVEEEMKLLTELAGDIAFAMDHLKKAAKLARMTRVNAMLSETNAAIVRIRDRQALFEEACRIAVEAGQIRLAWIGIVDPLRGLVVPAAFSGAEQGILGIIQLSTREDSGRFGMAGRAIRDLVPAVSHDLLADERIRYSKEQAERGIRSLAMIPLIVHGTALGVLGLHVAEAGFFNRDEMKLLIEVAGNIAFALEHIQKEEKVKQLTRTYAVLSGVNNAIVHIAQRDVLFKELCRIAVADGGFIAARVVELDSSGIARIAASNEFALPLFQKIVDDYNDDTEGSQNLLAHALRSGQPTISNDVASDIRMPNRVALTADGSFAVALLPINVGQRVAGMVVLRAREAGMFDETEMRLLTELVSNIAFAIDHIDKQARLDYLTHYDALTGLANRRLFLERLAQHMRTAVSSGHRLALLFLDLERFRNINDSLGRPTGDALLKQVSEWLSHTVGDTNLLAHLGADHFAIIVPEVKQGDAAYFLDERIRNFLDHSFRVNDTEIRVACKIGAALFPNNGVDANTLLRNAEAAVKRTKARGDRFLYYTRTMNEEVAGNLTLENQLRQALDNEEFELHYQPKVNLNSGKLAGAEALIRWNDPRTGLVPPGRFIPILEETGLIHEVGRWAMRKAIEQSLRWRAAGLFAMRVAVNVSPLQLRSPGFITEVQQMIGIDARAAAGLELEITESVIMADVRHSIDTLQAVRAMGICIAIDDFGTGFSSLSYLAKLPVDTLKIDRSFVIDMTSGPDGMALVSMIINLAHSLKLTVVAEGVETEEQSRLLRLLHCDQIQGFLFSKPVPAEEFEAKFLADPVLA